MRQHLIVDLLVGQAGVGRPQVARQVGDLAVPDVVSGQLGRSELGPAPLARCLAFLLVTAACHQRHGFRLGHAVPVDPGVEDGVDDRAQLHLELLHPDRAGIALARILLLSHDPFGINRPSLGERARPQRRPDRGVRAGEPARVLQLQVVAGHGLMHHQVVHHVPVVLAVERGDSPGRPVRRRRRHRDERRQRRGLERAGGVAVGHRDPAVDFRHRDQLHRVVVDRD